MIRILCCLCVLAIGTSSGVRRAAASEEPLQPRYRTDRIVVRFAPDVARALAVLDDSRATRRLGVARVDAVARGAGVRAFQREFPGELEFSGAVALGAFWLADLESGADPHRAAAELTALPEVVSAEPIAILPVSAVPNDSLWTAAYHLFQPSRKDIHAPEAWDVTTGDPSIVMAVLDTGVLPWHPDIGGRDPGSRGQFWVNTLEENGVAGVDDDGNGFVDDVWGWDFVDLPNSAGLPVQEDWDIADPDPNDLAGHGTAVAGIAAGATNNVIGISGVAWNARLMAVRVGWSSDRAPLGEVDMATAARGIVYAYRNGAKVINCSFATNGQSDLLAAGRAAAAAGALVVMASGNSGTPQVLGELDEVMAVAATDANDRVTLFSNRGSYVDIAAPGVGLATTFLRRDGVDSVSARTPIYTIGATGTSFAAPIVAGVAALIQSHRVAQGLPLLTPLELRLRIQDTSDDIAALNPSFPGYGSGRVNAARALTPRVSSMVHTEQALTVSAPIVTPAQSGGVRVWFLDERSRLVVHEGVTGERLAAFAAPGPVAGGLAAAYTGPALGTAFFYPLVEGRLVGVNAQGDALPGWPVVATPTFGPRLLAPAIGDLDGDGSVEVVWAGDDGNVWAWRIDGTRLPGFPRPVGGFRFNGFLALAPLDGEPGAEIVVATSPGVVHALRFDGTELPGWPVATSEPPVSLAVAATRNGPLVVVAGGNRATALVPAGLQVWSTDLFSAVTTEIAAGDLDGNGDDEIVIATNNSLWVLNASGLKWNASWPKTLAGPAVSPVIIGSLGPSGTPAMMTAVTGSSAGVELVAWRANALPLPLWPLPGHAGRRVALVDSDSDGATEVWAGTGPDSSFFVYDAGEDTWLAEAQLWPDAGANPARTYARTYAPLAPFFDDVPPEQVVDLVIEPGADAPVAKWTAVADEGPEGMPQRYELRAGPAPFDEADFDSQPHAWSIPAASASGEVRFEISDLDTPPPHVFRVAAVDAAGNHSIPSNAVQLGRALSAIRLAVEHQPARGTAVLQWELGGAHHGAARIQIFDATGRMCRELALGAGFLGTTQWDGRDGAGALLPPGLYFARLRSGTLEASTRIVFLR